MNRILGLFLFGLFSFYAIVAYEAVGAAIEGTQAPAFDVLAARAAYVVTGVKSVFEEEAQPKAVDSSLQPGVSAPEENDSLVVIEPKRVKEAKPKAAKRKHQWRWVPAWHFRGRWCRNGTVYAPVHFVEGCVMPKLTTPKGGFAASMALCYAVTAVIIAAPFVWVRNNILLSREVDAAIGHGQDRRAHFSIEDISVVIDAIETCSSVSVSRKRFALAVAAVAAVTLCGDESFVAVAMAAAPSALPEGVSYKEGQAAVAGERLSRKVLASIAKFNRKVELAAGYQLFPTLMVTGEAHGSQPGHSLQGLNAKKKARAPKVTLEASGRWNAAIVQQLAEINARQAEKGLPLWQVGPTDVIFTEFRDASPVDIVASMRSVGYVPAGPGVFVKLGDDKEYNKWILSVCRSAKDTRSYGRSYTTSPVLEFISKDIPVHFVSLKEMGVGTDGASFVTQGLDGISSLAFQVRFISSPKELWTWAKMTFGLLKGLMVQAKIIKNVTTGEAEWVDMDLWEKLKKTDVFDGNCPVVKVDGTEYQAGFFMDTNNMAKAELKNVCKSLADGKKVTTVDGGNFISFVIAEQFAGKTSLGWQTIQLLHATLLKRHEEALRGKIANKLTRYMSDDFDEALKDNLTKSYRGLRAIPHNALNVINMLKSISGKGMSRLIYGGGLSMDSDYVLEMEDMPAGWAIHKPPRSANHDGLKNKAAWSADSRYPQQGFESLIAMRNISPAQVARLYDHVVLGLTSEEKLDDDIVKGDTGKFLRALDKKCDGDEERVKLVLTAIKSSLPFVKIGCKIISHDDQFGRLRGDSDGDKNFWSYDLTIVAIVKEIESLAKNLPLPRLEIAGDGVQIDPSFDNASWLEVATNGLAAQKEGRHFKNYMKCANLLCAAKNGQGPVGLIYNLTTIPLARLKWSIQEINDSPQIVWDDQKAAVWFAYLLLMGQTAIDMQKRIYPPQSLLKWASARLFKSDGDQAEALIPPGQEGAHYEELGKEEIIWTMSPKMSMGINAYEEGLMYNERALSHWAAWVLNSIIFNYDFLNSRVMFGKEEMSAMEAGSKILADEGVEAFYRFVAASTEASLEKVQNSWVMTEDLITWKKYANLQEVVGQPSGGIRTIWEWAINEFVKAKKAAGINGGSPLDTLAGFWTQELEDEAFGGIGSKHRYRHQGQIKEEAFSIKFLPIAWVGMYRIFSELTSKERKEVAESEFMQGDTPKDASAMKRMMREMFDHHRVETDGLATKMQFVMNGKSMAMGQVFNKLFSNDSNWSAEKRKVVAQAMFRSIYASMVTLAKVGAKGSNKKAVGAIDNAIKANLIRGKEGFTKSCPKGVNSEDWVVNLEKAETLINRLAPIWNSEENRALRSAVRQWGFPKIVDAGLLGVTVSGKGFPEDKVNHTAMVKFVMMVRKSYENSANLKTAEWLADSVWPVLGLIYDLTEETIQRGNLLAETVTLDDGSTANMHHMPTFSEDRTKQVIAAKVSLRGLIQEAVLDTWTGAKYKERRQAVLEIVDSVKEEELGLVVSKDLQFILELILTSRFQRKVLATLRPITGAARSRLWHSQWFDWGTKKHPGHGLNKAAYVAAMVHKSVYNETYLKNSEGMEVVDEYGAFQVSSRWFKSAVKFDVPPAFSGELFHNMLSGKLSTNGMYLLCQEGRAGGRYSVARWCFFDAMTYRLGIQNLPSSRNEGEIASPKYANAVFLRWLMAHLDPRINFAVGMAYHDQHYTKAMATCQNLESYRVTFLKGALAGEVIAVAQKTINRFLVPHLFNYSLKGEQGSYKITVRLPYLFGANNKLATPTDKLGFFMSSKMWSLLSTLGLVDFKSHSFRVSAAQWKAVFGFDYPTSGRDGGHSQLRGAGRSKAKVKQPLPWFNAATENVRQSYLNSVGYGPCADLVIAEQGLLAPRAAVMKAIELRYDNEITSQQIRNAKLTEHKAILGCLGLSSVQYQLELLTEENLANPAKRDFVTPVARSWAATSVSGLRDLFGGLGDHQGWSVGQTHYVRPLRAKVFDKETVMKIVEEIFKAQVNRPERERPAPKKELTIEVDDCDVEEET
jgi:hypothetical protein